MTTTEDHTPHVLRVDDENGLPFAYQRNVLRVDPDRVDETLAEIQAIKSSPGSGLENLTLERKPHKQPGSLELTGVELNALEVRDMLNPALAAKALRVQAEPAYVAGDPLLGMPAKHGHGTARAGINLVGVAPPARSAADLESGRRPVVAVLDTPVREHPWLGDGEGDDAFWRDARRVGGPWTPDFAVPEETAADGRLVAAGHGTFIAGIVRLLAPDARVLSVPIMHGDAVVDEEHVVSALEWLRDRVMSSLDGRHERFVDVVNLSFGRYLESGEDARFREEARSVLGELAQLGVRVVASAGNQDVPDDVFPAILGKDGIDSGHTPLVSVGALDPDGTPAAYTSTADWVSVEAPGSSLVSTLPDFDRTEYPLPEDRDDDGDLVKPDPNFQASGIGQWSGTSFAAAWVSASIAAKLLEQATRSSLVDTAPAAVGVRAKSAWEAVVADLEDWIASHGVVD